MLGCVYIYWLRPFSSESEGNLALLREHLRYHKEGSNPTEDQFFPPNNTACERSRHSFQTASWSEDVLFESLKFKIFCLKPMDSLAYYSQGDGCVAANSQ